MTSSQSSFSTRVVPAQLSYLAIYNPSYGQSDETAHEQIFFYHDNHRPEKHGDATSTAHRAGEGQAEKHEYELNQKLRRIGLARGMVEFAK